MTKTITETEALTYTKKPAVLRIACSSQYQEIVITDVHLNDPMTLAGSDPFCGYGCNKAKNLTAEWEYENYRVQSSYLQRKKQWKICISIRDMSVRCTFPYKLEFPIFLNNKTVIFRVGFDCTHQCYLPPEIQQPTETADIQQPSLSPDKTGSEVPKPSSSLGEDFLAFGDKTASTISEHENGAPDSRQRILREKAAEREKSRLLSSSGKPVSAGKELPGPRDRKPIVLKEGEQYLEFLLAIDLGNTRSCALLCGDVRNITRHGSMQICKLPLSGEKNSDSGVFDSYVSFSLDTHRWSFTRVGKDAGTVANELRGKKDGIGDFYLSSPKRYFWDSDENLNGWQVLTNGAETSRLSADQERVAAELAKELHESDVSHLSRAGILAAMLFEIMERTQDYIDSEACYLKSALPKILSHICVTFPAGWSDLARQRYQQVLSAAVRVYERMRNVTGCKPITIDVSCDEAAAVLLCYIYGEIAKYSGKVDVWLREIGRTLPMAGTQARVAVIDIGGGTSDLAIVNVQNASGNGGLALEIDKLYKDGADRAGDLLLQKVTEKILICKVAEKTINPAAADEAVKTAHIKQLGARLNSLLADSRVRQLSRRFWFPLAVNFISEVNRGGVAFKVPDSRRQLMEIIGEHAKEWTENNVAELEETLEITDQDRKEFARQVKRVFSKTAKLFGAAICAFDADVVILAGKTTENIEVSKIFQKYCYLPECRFIRMWNYMIGDWCPVSEGGRIRDSKYTTAIGAVLYDVLNHHFPIQAIEAGVRTETAPGLNDGNCLWGVAHVGDNFSVDDAILSSRKHDCWIEFAGHPQLLARRRFAVDDTEVAISYELRLKPFKRRIREWEAWKRDSSMSEFEVQWTGSGSAPMEEILLARNNRNPLKTPKIVVEIGKDLAEDTGTVIVISSVNGTYANGTPVRKEDIQLRRRPRDLQLESSVQVHLSLQTDKCDRAFISVTEVNGKYEDGSLISSDDFEIRIRTSGDDMFWLDSGRI